MNEKQYRVMFLVGAVWNVLGGVAIVVLTPWIFRVSNATVPHPPVYYYSWIALFVTFGIGYYMVSRDPAANRNIVLLGVIGKLAFAAIYFVCWAIYKPLVPSIFAIAALGDLIFVVLFGSYLRFGRNCVG